MAGHVTARLVCVLCDDQRIQKHVGTGPGLIAGKGLVGDLLQTLAAAGQRVIGAGERFR